MYQTFIEEREHSYETPEVGNVVCEDKDFFHMGYFPTNGSNWFNNNLRSLCIYNRIEDSFDEEDRTITIERAFEIVFG